MVCLEQGWYIEELTRFSQCLNAKTGFVKFWSVYQSFSYWIFMFQIVHFQKILQGQCLNKNRLTAPLYILLGETTLWTSYWCGVKHKSALIILFKFLYCSTFRSQTVLKNSVTTSNPDRLAADSTAHACRLFNLLFPRNILHFGFIYIIYD